MSDSNIFSQGQTSDQSNSGNAPPQNLSSNDSFADLLGSIKNEKGEPKYRDVTTALDALKHSQEFIPQVKNENEQLKNEISQLKEQLSKLSLVEQQIQKLTSQQEPVAQQQPVFDEKLVADLVTKTLSTQQQKAIQQANIQTVVTAMKNSLGQDAEKVFYAKAAEFGMQPEDINSLAAKTPQAVLKLFGLSDNQSQAQNKPLTQATGGINTSGYEQKPDSFVRKNDKGVLLGATTADTVEELRSANKLVEELHSKDLSVYDLTDPKVYFKYFK